MCSSDLPLHVNPQPPPIVAVARPVSKVCKLHQQRKLTASHPVPHERGTGVHGLCDPNALLAPCSRPYVVKAHRSMGFDCPSAAADTCCFCFCNRVLQFPNATRRYNENGASALRLQQGKVGGAAARVQRKRDIHWPRVMFDEAAHTRHVGQTCGSGALLQQPQRFAIHVHSDERYCREELKGGVTDAEGARRQRRGITYGGEDEYHVTAATAKIYDSECLALTRKLARLQQHISR